MKLDSCDGEGDSEDKEVGSVEISRKFSTQVTLFLETKPVE